MGRRIPSSTFESGRMSKVLEHSTDRVSMEQVIGSVILAILVAILPNLTKLDFPTVVSGSAPRVFHSLKVQCNRQRRSSSEHTTVSCLGSPTSVPIWRLYISIAWSWPDQRSPTRACMSCYPLRDSNILKSRDHSYMSLCWAIYSPRQPAACRPFPTQTRHIGRKATNTNHQVQSLCFSRKRNFCKFSVLLLVLYDTYLYSSAQRVDIAPTVQILAVSIIFNTSLSVLRLGIPGTENLDCQRKCSHKFFRQPFVL